MEDISRGNNLNMNLSSCDLPAFALNKTNALGCNEFTLPLPSFTITAPSFDGSSNESKHSYFPRKFSFQAFRKSSGSSSIYRSDSMVSVSYRTLVNYIYDDNYDEFCTFLNNKRVIIDDKDENGATALHFAASCGKLRFVRELLNHGADPNISDSDNWCPLAVAAKEGYTDVCLALIDNNAELEHKDLGSWTSLMWACYKGREETVVALVNRGADVNACGNHHVTALMWATGRGFTSIAKFLVSKGAKVTIRDKFGTTALIWAARRGDLESAKCFIEAGATVDASGMYCWTPLIVAALGNHVEMVELLLEHKANVNCTDKDGCSALTIACREGFYDIVIALLDAGAYISIQDKTRDSNLIYAVKNGHRSIVEALLKRYADVNIIGRDNKTAVYCAVEKGNIAILKLLLDAKPDLEISAKDGDTPLLRAVRFHNFQAVKMLQEAGAKVDIRDKRGDNPLHIAIRARSKTITELLISDVRNAHLLNCPNNVGETPYQIDYDDEKPVMHQIYGARAMNSNAENENSLGYDLYSCALAAILSEPDLSMPITVGLYAKWGSGKSFLLNKVTEEMKNFSRQWLLPMLEFQWLLAIIILHVATIIGVAVFLISTSYIIGVSSFCVISLFFYCWLLLIFYAGTKVKFLYNLNLLLTRKMKNIRIILQIIFCYPPGLRTIGSSNVVPIKYYFANQSKVTTTTAGENMLVSIIGTLFDAIENDHGTLPTRLYRAFTPKSVKRHSTWKWRKLCCIPNIIVFELNLISILVGIICSLKLDYICPSCLSNASIKPYIVASCGVFVGFCVASNMYMWTHMLKALMFPQRKHLQKTISSLETVKSEGFMEAIRTEVNFMIDMVRCMDSFLKQQSRLVIIIDGLDSCEQDKVLLILDTVNVLFSEADTPFITFISIDPFIISKMIEVNSRRLLSETNVGGHDYLRNLVQLPFYLQNSGLRRVKVAQKCSQQRKSFSNQISERLDDNAVSRRLSNESGVSSNEKLKVPGTGPGVSGLSRNAKGGSRKLKLSDSVASSIASNLNRMGGAQDLTHMLCSDDYFSEVNPRSMRRLMNVACVTGRLLKSFQIDFNWYHLASWVNITEQWPYRTTCLILYHDTHEDSLEDSMTLKSIYDKIRPFLPISKEVEPLLEFDRDEKKFDIFLKYHRSSLQVADLRIFLPFTVNLDPHIKRMIKEKQQKLEDTSLLAYNTTGDFGMSWLAPSNSAPVENSWFNVRKTPFIRRESRTPYKTPMSSILQQPALHQPYASPPGWPNVPASGLNPFLNPSNAWLYDNIAKANYLAAPSTLIVEDIPNVKLTSLKADAVCNLLKNMKELQNSPKLEEYLTIIKQNNIIGSVLFHCDLDELKSTMKMTFGDWELFKVLILSLREKQLLNLEEDHKNVKFNQNQHNLPHTPPERKGSGSLSKNNHSNSSQDQGDAKNRSSGTQSETEKQVTMEDQLICGALQTLNEEACEDVLEETEDVKSMPTVLSLPESEPEVSELSEKGFSRSGKELETNTILLQSSSISPRWSPVCAAQNWYENDTGSAILVDSTSSTPNVLRRESLEDQAEFKLRSNRCRPSSLLITNPEELEQMLTLDERKAAHAAIIRSSSVDDGNLKRGAYSSLLVDSIDKSIYVSQSLSNAMPVLTITPALSGSTSDFGDENTLLVDEVPDSGRTFSLIDDDNFCLLSQRNNVPSSDGMNPLNSSTLHLHTSSNSVHTNPETYCALSCVNEQYSSENSLLDMNQLFRTTSSKNMDEAEYKWTDSETTV